MSPKIRIADGLLTQTAERLITTAGAIITGMTGNPAYPSPPVDLKTVQAAVDDLARLWPHGLMEDALQRQIRITRRRL